MASEKFLTGIIPHFPQRVMKETKSYMPQRFLKAIMNQSFVSFQTRSYQNSCYTDRVVKVWEATEMLLLKRSAFSDHAFALIYVCTRIFVARHCVWTQRISG